VSELKHVYSLSTIFRQAWIAAKRDALTFGGRARHYFSEALRQAWSRAKATREMRARVLAEVERIKADQQPLARARREKKLNAFMAECDASLAKALEMSRRLTQPAIRRAA
jgi:hypothetical protein